MNASELQDARGHAVVGCSCNHCSKYNAEQVYSALAQCNMTVKLHCHMSPRCYLPVIINKCHVQVIPHNFGRQRPPIIHSQKMVEDKICMCDVLSDIEVAQDLLETKPQEEEEQVELQPHPADDKYTTLQTDLDIIQPAEEEYKIVQKFAEV